MSFTTRKRLGDVLLDEGLITNIQLLEGLEKSRRENMVLPSCPSFFDKKLQKFTEKCQPSALSLTSPFFPFTKRRRSDDNHTVMLHENQEIR